MAMPAAKEKLMESMTKVEELAKMLNHTFYVEVTHDSMEDYDWDRFRACIGEMEGEIKSIKASLTPIN